MSCCAKLPRFSLVDRTCKSLLEIDNRENKLFVTSASRRCFFDSFGFGDSNPRLLTLRHRPNLWNPFIPLQMDLINYKLTNIKQSKNSRKKMESLWTEKKTRSELLKWKAKAMTGNCKGPNLPILWVNPAEAHI